MSLKLSQDVPVAWLGTGTLSPAQCSSVSPQVPLTVTYQRVFMALLGSQGFEGLIPGSLQCHPGSGASVPQADVTAQPAAVN